MDMRRRAWLPCLIFTLSLWFYLSLISCGPVSVDGLDLAVKSEYILKSHHFAYLYGFGYPLMVVWGVLFTWLGHLLGITDNVLAINFIGVFFGAASVLSLYLLVHEWMGEPASIIASLILLFNPIFLDVCTYGLSHAPTLCFLLLGLLFLARFHIYKKNGLFLSSALCFGLMGATRLQDLILLLPFIAIVLMFTVRPLDSAKGLRLSLLFAMTVIGVTLVFYSSYFLDGADYFSQLKSFWRSGLTENFKGLFSPSLQASFAYLTKSLTWIGVFCFVAGLFQAIRLDKKPVFSTIVWWLTPLGFYGNLVTTAPRFLTIVLPGFIIPVSFFIAGLSQRNNIGKALALISLLLIIFVPFLNTEETFIRRHHVAYITDFYRWVGTSTQPNALIICSDDAPLISYYAHRKVLYKPEGARHLSKEELMDFKKETDEALRNKTKVYVTGMGLNAYDYYSEFRNFMQRHYRLTEVGQKPLELWYTSPFDPKLHMSKLMEVLPLSRLDIVHR